MDKTEKKPPIVLIISFIPCVFLLLYAIYSAVFGFELFVKSYGLETYVLIIALFIYGMPYVYIPCFSYQIFYAVKRIKRRDGMYTPPSIARIILRIAIGLYISGYLIVGICIIGGMF